MNYSNIVLAVSGKQVLLNKHTTIRTMPVRDDKLTDGTPVHFRLYHIRTDYVDIGKSFVVEVMQVAMDTVVPTPEWFAEQMTDSITLHDTLEQAVEASGYSHRLELFNDVYQTAVEKAVRGKKVVFASSTDQNYKTVGIFLQDEEMAVSLKLRVK